MDSRSYIAVDLGAESGRVMLGEVSDEEMNLREVHRFANEPVTEDGLLRWDFPALLSEIKTGIGQAASQAEHRVAGIGIDSWGVDFGLIDSSGELVEKPWHYRDPNRHEMRDEAFKTMPSRELYQHSGVQLMPINGLYQLMYLQRNRPEALERADRLIMIADLFSYYLCGHPYSEYTIASTSQMLDMRTGEWSREVLETFDLPVDIMPDVVDSGTMVGELTADVAREIGCDRLPVIATASHDTGSAVAAIPAMAEEWGYISSGTWSIQGVELDDVEISDASFRYGFGNEGGVEGTIRFLKNIMGLWLLQECRRTWEDEDDTELSYEQLQDMAEQAEPFPAFMDADHEEFLAPGDMPSRINEYLENTGQDPIQDRGSMSRLILESLGFKYRSVLEQIHEVAGTQPEVLHIVGGGTQNELLNQLAADATGMPVVIGPVEATAMGNVMMQAIGTGQISSLSDGRELIRRSADTTRYEPQNVELWEEKYEQYRDVTGIT